MVSEFTVETLKLLRELAGTVCRCGAKKKSRQTFCGRCYHSLPRSVALALYRRVGDGYEEAYAKALKHLKAGE